MDTQAILKTIQDVIIIPLILVVGGAVVAALRTKMQEWSENVTNKRNQRYIELLGEVVATCVDATTQTYVQALKDENMFDAEAQKKALTQTKQAVLSSLNASAKAHLSVIYGDLEEQITQQIESYILNTK